MTLGELNMIIGSRIRQDNTYGVHSEEWNVVIVDDEGYRHRIIGWNFTDHSMEIATEYIES